MGISNSHAQAPQKMSYQAVVRTSDNQLVQNRSVRMRISILSDSINGTASYVETHQLTTNPFGVVQLEIGGGSVVSGNFATIPWSKGKIFIKTETDPAGGTNYTLASTTQMMSVPYALYANDVPVSKSGDTVTIGKSRLIIPGALLLPGTNMPSSLSNGLLAYYPFNGNANDESGNNNNGAVRGATLTTDRFGNSNKAFSFNGTSEYIRVLNSTSLNPTSITISAWVNVSSAPVDNGAGARSIVSKWIPEPNCGKEGENYTVQVSRLNNNSVIALATSLNNSIASSLNSVIDLSDINAWKHIVFTHDSKDGQKLYINGTLVKSNAVAGSLCSTTNDLFIGADNNFNIINRYFGGKLDEIRLYNRSLTQEEIIYLASN
jgi:hypothetical protein